MRGRWSCFWCVFGLGAFLYCAIETVYRGHTHWSMGVAGGVCLTALYHINDRMKRASLFAKALAGAAFITAVEFMVGWVVNIRLGWGVWDYSDRPLNIMGQICPAFSAVWFVLAVMGIKISGALQRRIG